MKMLITGASGSGTTSLGKAMAARLGWHFIDTDDHYWLPTKPPYQSKRDTAARLEMMLAELSGHESSIVSGSVMNWGRELEDSFDLIVFLYLDTAIRLRRLKIREERELGQVDPEFIEWASQYDNGTTLGRSLVIHKKWLAKRKCRVLNIEGTLSVEERCELVMEALPDWALDSEGHD